MYGVLRNCSYNNKMFFYKNSQEETHTVNSLVHFCISKHLQLHNLNVSVLCMYCRVQHQEHQDWESITIWTLFCKKRNCATSFCLVMCTRLWRESGMKIWEDTKIDSLQQKKSPATFSTTKHKSEKYHNLTFHSLFLNYMTYVQNSQRKGDDMNGTGYVLAFSCSKEQCEHERILPV